MLWNLLKTIWRNARKYRLISIINLAGLAVGLACCILISLWIQDELSFDRFHQKADRIYRVVFSTADDGQPTNANGSYGVGPALVKDFPEVIQTVRLRKMGQDVKRYVGYKDKKFYESRFFFAEPTILTVFDFLLIKGDPATALSKPNSIILTRQTATKYFGNEDPVGKVIEADPYNDGNMMRFLITGVAENVPDNSHFHFDFLASYSTLKEDTESFRGFYQHFTYILLDHPRAAPSVEGKLLDFLHRHWREDPWYTLRLQPLLDIHLHSRLKSEIQPTGSIVHVHIFTLIALLVLVIACINFMNLITACAVRRAREVGIRKVVGARKRQLVKQFLGESLLLSLVSVGIALFLIYLVLPVFGNLTGKEFSYSSILHPFFLAGLGGVVLIVGFLSGIYPAFLLSSFRPVQTLKSRPSYSSQGDLVRKGLLVFQFVLSIGVIFAALVSQRQMNYIQSKNLGYDRKQLVVIPLNRDLRRDYESFRNELIKHPGIENTATSSLVPTRGSYHINFRFKGNDESITQVIYMVDKEFMTTFGIQLLAGRNNQTTAAEGGPIGLMISNLSMKEAGYASPVEAVGESFTMQERQGHIAGVVNDIKIYSLHRPQYPINYVVTPIDRHNYLTLRLHPRSISDALGHLQKTWQDMMPNYPLDYFFLDASFQRMHLADQKMSRIISIFSFLAVFVACLGLFGLTAYTVEQKTKEIGIRKVLGASIPRIYLLLTHKFLRWVIVANLIAWPLAYYAIDQWLKNFALRINMNIWPFFISGSLVLGIAMLTVSFQALRAARANPVESLRYE